MIRYPVTQKQLEAAVDAHSPTWRERARERTLAFRQAGGYSEPPAPIWSEIKPVFMRLQHDKCAYCERQLGSVERGQIEHDIEHFRPKNGVRAWPSTPEQQTRLGYDFAAVDAFEEGYYLLAYHLLNYAVACKICNTVLKSNYFPVAASHISGQGEPRNLAAEQALLIYPLGDLDQNPEDLIYFDGPVPLPRSSEAASYAYQRARVTIDFFELATREELVRERLRIMGSLWLALRGEAQAGSEAAQAEFAGYVKLYCDPAHPHCNFARSYKRLFDTNREKAQALAASAKKLLLEVCDPTFSS